MTTNQTIDGVPRELLEPFATYVSDSPNAIMRARAKELRALLDAPANPPTCLPVSGGRGIRMSGVQRFHEAANDALVKLSKHCVPGTKMALVIYAPGEPELDIVLQDKGLSLDEVISTLRRSGLSIDGDNTLQLDRVFISSLGRHIAGTQAGFEVLVRLSQLAAGLIQVERTVFLNHAVLLGDEEIGRAHV